MDLSFFAEMVWKSALIAGAALALAGALRSRSAADRALVLRIGVAMLLLLPLLAALLPGLEIIAFAAPEPATAAGAFADLALLTVAGVPAAAPEPTIWDDPTPLVLLAYAGGLAMVGSRLLAGLWTLHRWTRSAVDVTCPEWRDAFDRVRWILEDGEEVRLLVSPLVSSPISWGWRRPVILLDPDSLAAPEDAEAILAHEIAHIARRDWPMLILARVAATLFWFNPLVWRLEREVVQQAEEAADCTAAERVEPARYAETLLNWARPDALVPAHGIAPKASALGRRVRAILDRSIRERPSGSAWTAMAMLACIGLAAPVAAMQLVPAPPAEASDAPEPPAAPAAPATVPDAPPAPEAPEAPESRAYFVVVPDGEVADVGTIVEDAMAGFEPAMTFSVSDVGVDAAEIERSLREAHRELRRIDRGEIERSVREAQRRTFRIQRERVAPREHIESAMREVRRIQVVAPRAIAVSMANGAAGMIAGAAGMEQGAERMEQQAARLRDREYRERQIVQARERGETVTHEQLLEAAEGLREGAEGMREGAREMREAAERMRNGRS